MTGKDHLPRVVDERGEGVKKLLLRFLLPCQEVDVVDDQHIERAEALTKFLERPLLETLDELVRELFGGEVLYTRRLVRRTRPLFKDVIATPSAPSKRLPKSLQQMRLADRRRAVQIKWVEHGARTVKNARHGVQSQPVANPDHKTLKRWCKPVITGFPRYAAEFSNTTGLENRVGRA